MDVIIRLRDVFLASMGGQRARGRQQVRVMTDYLTNRFSHFIGVKNIEQTDHALRHFAIHVCRGVTTDELATILQMFGPMNPRQPHALGHLQLKNHLTVLARHLILHHTPYTPRQLVSPKVRPTLAQPNTAD